MNEPVGFGGDDRPSQEGAPDEAPYTPAELAVELSDLNDRLEAFDTDDGRVLWVAVPAAVALGWGMWIGFRLLGPDFFVLWLAVSLVFFVGAVLFNRAWKGRERSALLEDRARVMALLTAHADGSSDDTQ